MMVEQIKKELIIKGTDSDPVKSRVRKYQFLPKERWARFIEAGEGNYEKTKENGKYRYNCLTTQTYPSPLKKCDSCGDVRKIIAHCDKFDCSACFTWTAYERANRIVGKHKRLEKEAKRRGIKIGKPIHFVFSPRKILALLILINKRGVDKLREIIENILQDTGIHSSTITFHLQSIKCKTCKKELKKCYCSKKEQELYKALNPHFHVFGYGFVENVKIFKNKHPNWNYFKEGVLQDKENLFRAVFYALSKCSIWRMKETNELVQAYRYSGFLRTGLKKISEKSKYVAEKCRCTGTYHFVKKGYEIRGDKPEIDKSLSILEQAKILGIQTKKKIDNGKWKEFSLRKIKKLIENKVKVNNNLEIFIDNDKVVLGKPVIYKKKIIKYKLENVREFRRVVKECKKRYLEQKKGLSLQTIVDEGNGDG